MRRSLGPTDFPGLGLRPRGAQPDACTLRGADYKGGERYGDVPGKYFGRVRATVPASFPPTSTTGAGARRDPLITGDTVTVTVRAGGQEQVFSYRVVSTPPGRGEAAHPRRRGRGLHRHRAEPARRYDTAPRYLAPARRCAEGRRLRGRHLQRRRACRHDQVPDVPRRALALRRRPVLHRRRPRPAGSGPDELPTALLEPRPR